MSVPFLAAALLGSLIPTVGSVVGTVGAAALAFNSTNDMSSKKTNTEEFTVPEAAEMLGLSEYTIKKKIREGALSGRIVGKKYMVSKRSLEEYAKNAGKSNTIRSVYSFDEEFVKTLDDIPSVQTILDQTKIQQEIFNIECKKLELEKKMASKKNDEDQIHEISQKIMDTTIQSLQCSQIIKLCEAQIIHLKKLGNTPNDEQL